MSDLTPSRGGKRVGAGRKPGDIGMADRIKRYAVAEKAAQYADEIISYYGEVFRKPRGGHLGPHGGGQVAMLWEAAFGKPAQAVVAEAVEDVKHTLIVRWLAPSALAKT